MMEKPAGLSNDPNIKKKSSKNGLCGELCNQPLKFLGFSELFKNEDDIKEVLEEDGKTKMSQVIKILVVGPGDSGKSTILKQMRLIHGNNYSDIEKLKFKPIIVRNIVESIANLVCAMKMFSLDFAYSENEENADSILTCRSRLNDGLDDWDQNAEAYATLIEAIWKDPSIKACVDRRNLFYLSDSIDYFIVNLSRICTKNYVPNTDDILRARQPTTAILEYKYKIASSYFLFVDVGGQRSERRKWINCFENVTSLLFVASMSDFDSFLTQDELTASNSGSSEVNRMRDAINLFKVLINWKKKIYYNEGTSVKSDGSDNVKINQPRRVFREGLLFEKVSIILFLNKEDLFDKKFGHSSIKTCFEDYDTSLSRDDSKRFIATKFIESNENPNREIYWHYTYALDRNNINMVVMSVKDKIIKYMMESIKL